MTWKSRQQEKCGNSAAGHEALGDKAVDEFNSASKGKDLPKKVHDHQRGKLHRAEHMGEHMSTIHDTGHD